MWKLVALLSLVMTPFSPGLSRSAEGADVNRLEPILAVPAEIHLQMDFGEDFVVRRGHAFFRLGQGTTWKASDGLLVGTESSPEYQAKKKT